MHASDRYYRDSGAVPFTGSLLTTALGLLAGVVVGAVYGIVSYWNPFLLLQILAGLLVGVGVGLAVNFATVVGKVRNPLFPRLVGLAAGVFAVYAEWVAYFWANGVWVVQPELLLAGIDLVAEASDMGRTVCLLLWGGEAIVVVGLSVMLAGIRDTPFCEECGEWADEFEDCALLDATDPERLRQDLEDERYEVLDELRDPADPQDCLRATVYRCPCDGEENYLTVKHVVVTHDSDGEENRAETEIVRRIWVPDEVAERLLAPVVSGDALLEELGIDAPGRGDGEEE